MKWNIVVRLSFLGANISVEMKWNSSVCLSYADFQYEGRKKFVRLSYLYPIIGDEMKLVRRSDVDSDNGENGE